MNGGEQIRCAVQKMMSAAVTMVALALTACSGEPEATQPTDAEGSSEATERIADADTVLHGAISTTVTGPAMGFTYTARIAGSDVISIEGLQRPRGGWSATVSIDDPSTPGDDHLDMEARSTTTDTVWMQMEAWRPPMRGCWLALDNRQVPVGITGLMADEVSYVSMLRVLEAVDFADASATRIDVTVELQYALSIVQGQVIDAIDFKDASAARAPVAATVELAQGRVATVEFSGAAFQEALEGTNATMSEIADQTLGLTEFVVTYPSAEGEPAGPPDSELVVTQAEAQQGCH